MVDAPKVAGVVVTFNRPNGLVATINALRAQSHALDQIIVVNNGGEVDGSISGRQDITVVEPGENTGAAGGYALGLIAAVDAGFDWAMLVNDDDRPRPMAVEVLLDLATRQATPSMAMGWVSLSGKEVATGAWLRHGLKYPVASQVEGAYQVDVATFGGLLVPTEVVRDVGPPRADFFMMWEEYEFCLRARRAGWRIMVLPETLVDIDGMPPGSRSRPWRGYYEARNSWIALREHGNFLDRLWLLVRNLKYLLASLSAPDRAERVSVRCRGLADGIRGRTGRTVDPS